jgi:hypothetical protein
MQRSQTIPLINISDVISFEMLFKETHQPEPMCYGITEKTYTFSGKDVALNVLVAASFSVSFVLSRKF